MRRAKLGWSVLVLVLAGCGPKQPEFDERYAAARQKLDASAAAIDREIAASGGTVDAAAATAPASP